MPLILDSDNNDENVNTLKNILRKYPTIKKIIIVKKRLPKSMQNAISSFMEAFPLKTFLGSCNHR